MDPWTYINIYPTGDKMLRYLHYNEQPFISTLEIWGRDQFCVYLVHIESDPIHIFMFWIISQIRAASTLA